MSKKNKICILISIIVGVVGEFVIKRYGSQIIKPSGHVIDEAFIKQCGACFGLITVLNSVFLGMVILPLVYLLGNLAWKPDKSGSIIICICICALLLMPIYSAAKLVKQDIKCQEYVIRNKECIKRISPHRGRSRKDYLIWIKGSIGYGSGFNTISSVYNSVEAGDDVYAVYVGTVLLNAFPVSEYEYKLAD